MLDDSLMAKRHTNRFLRNILLFADLLESVENILTFKSTTSSIIFCLVMTVLIHYYWALPVLLPLGIIMKIIYIRIRKQKHLPYEDDTTRAYRFLLKFTR